MFTTIQLVVGILFITRQAQVIMTNFDYTLNFSWFPAINVNIIYGDKNDWTVSFLFTFLLSEDE